MTKTTIDKNTKIGELLRKNPEAGKLLRSKFNLACIGCGGADQESLGQGAVAHGLDVEELIKELKKIL